MEYLAPHLGFLSADKPGGAQYNRLISEAEFHRIFVTHHDIPNFGYHNQRSIRLGATCRARLSDR